MDGGFAPLSAYGAIGTLETAALVGRDGAIDWLCLPYVYPPSVFAAILDPGEGGRFRIAPAGDHEAEQSYLDDTNVLVTTFETDSGTLQVTDFMPVLDEDTTEEPRMRALYRKVAVTDGSVDLRVAFEPRFDYAREATTVDDVADGVLATGESRRLALDGPADLDADDGAGRAESALDEGDDADWFVLQYSMRAPTSPDDCHRLLEDTVDFWRDWCHSCEESACPFGGVGHDAVVRSELLLKLLNYRETGALFAAPTTSLPEDPGGVRNWDYRFSWMRDGAMTVRALTNVGHEGAARDYVHRFVERSREGRTAEVQPVYGVEREDLEAPLDDWRACRETIRETTIERGFDEGRNAFIQSFEEDTLDATGLLIPLVGFLEPDDPRVEGTIDAIREHLGAGDGLLYRYEDDDLPGEEGAFLLCSFWLVDALTMAGRTDETWGIFERLLEHTSPLGLLAEEVDPETGRLLGNFPQGVSHIGLINSALYLREAEYDWATVDPLGAPTLGQERDAG